MTTVSNLHRLANRCVSFTSLVVLAAASACSTSSNPPAPNQMSRTALETAPADLQLLCAEAAKSDGAKALPTASRRLDDQTYRVDLNVDGSTKTCVIDDAGNIASMQAATS